MMATQICVSNGEVLAMNPVRVISMDRDAPFLAYCCAGMPDHWYGAMRMKWAADWSAAGTLEYRLWDEAVRMAIRFKWRTRKGDAGRAMLRRLAGLALYELADPERFRDGDVWQVKADWMGVGKTQWYGVWVERYKLVFDLLNEWTNLAWRWIKDNPQRQRGKCDV